MADQVHFGERLRTLREAAGWTQQELAERAGLATSAIAALERGRRQRPYPHTVEALADALKLEQHDRMALLRLVRPAASHPFRPAWPPSTGALSPAGPRAPAAPLGERDELDTLVATKLYLPRPPDRVVTRPRLLARLDAILTSPLTLIAAPAGFGKTTLLVAWLRQHVARGHPVAWLALDASDSDPIQFLRYLVAALQSIAPSVGTTVLPLLRSAQVAPVHAVLPALINDLVTLPEQSVVVLDDYHVIETPAVHQALAFLVEHLPPQLHLVIATRVDPPLPVSRLRVRGQLLELRAHDLRFTPEETATFLREVMDLPLSGEDVAMLEARTEGWIAGVQLAALSLQDCPVDQRAELITAFTGSHRFVVDYLVDEVLARQPAHLQNFLLQTSILGRLCGPLCDAIMIGEPSTVSHTDTRAKQPKSQVLLEQLERSNLFLVALDDARRWYRYHHLFAQVLQDRLARGASPEVVTRLHARTAAWFEQHGLLLEAVQHALAAKDWEHAARLIEEHSPVLAISGRVHTVLGWLTALPDALFRKRSYLNVIYGLALFFLNQLDAAELRLRAAEADLPAGPLDERSRSIHGYITVIRASIARYRGDLVRCTNLARQALELVPETNVLLRASPSVDVASDYVLSGDVTPANERRLVEAVEAAAASADLNTHLTGLLLLAGLRRRQGHLRKAVMTCREAAELVARRGLVNTAAYYFQLGDVLREWNQLDAAAELLDQGAELVLGSLATQADIVTFGYIAIARLKQARGDGSGAREALAQLQNLIEQRNFVSHLHSRTAAARAHLALLQGDLEDAVRWADTSGLDVRDTLDYLREAEYLTLARVRLEEGRTGAVRPSSRDALSLLDQLLHAAEAGGRMDSVIEILTLRALALEAQGNRKLALAALERALTIGAPEGYVRCFVDEGAPMATLLRRALEERSWGQPGSAQAQDVRAYAQQLLAVFRTERIEPWDVAHLSVPDLPVSTPGTDPLTRRELDILRLLACGRSNKAMASELIVAVGTIKRHVSNILDKLQVESRSEAVARARELGLI